MGAKVIDLTDYRRSRSERKRSKSDDSPAQVININTHKATESLKGRGFPDDFYFGYDEPEFAPKLLPTKDEE